MGLPDKRPSAMLAIDEKLEHTIALATKQGKNASKKTFSLAIATMISGLLLGGAIREDIKRTNIANERSHTYTNHHCRVLHGITYETPYAPTDALTLNLPLLCAGRPERRSYLPLILLSIPFAIGTSIVAHRSQYRMSNAERFGHERACIDDILERTRRTALYSTQPVNERSVYEDERKPWERPADEKES